MFCGDRMDFVKLDYLETANQYQETPRWMSDGHLEREFVVLDGTFVYSRSV